MTAGQVALYALSNIGIGMAGTGAGSLSEQAFLAIGVSPEVASLLAAGVSFAVSYKLGKYNYGKWAEVGQANIAASQGPKITSSETFSDWQDMKNAHDGTVTKFVSENKPKGSPIPKNWFDKGGSLTIETLEDGTQIWKYTLNGKTVPYVPKTVNGQVENVVQFPEEYLYSDPKISNFKIEDGFTGDRNLDKAKAMEYLASEGYTKIPDGYILQHDIDNGTFQIVQESIHQDFSHYGGYYYNK